MSDDLVFAPATELAEQIRSKSVSPTEVMQAHLSRIESVNPKLNAIVTPDETAMDQAREAEDALMRGELRGPLHGVPFTAKGFRRRKRAPHHARVQVLREQRPRRRRSGDYPFKGRRGCLPGAY